MSIGSITIHDIIFGTLVVAVAGAAAFRGVAGGDGQGLLVELFGGDEKNGSKAPPPASARTPVGLPTVSTPLTRGEHRSRGGGGSSGGGGGGILVHGPGGSTRVDPQQFASRIDRGGSTTVPGTTARFR